MIIQDLLKLKDSELIERLSEISTDLISTKLKILDGSETNTAKIRSFKKETARIHTILNERKRS